MASLRFDLRSAMQDFEARTGVRQTYESLADRTGFSVDTLKSMASRKGYNMTLKVLAALGEALKCDPRQHLTWHPDD